MIIRNEKKADHRAVEELTRNAFWNLNVPGCDEHYIVNIMRSHEDFIPELDFVIEHEGQIIANIMFTKAKIVDEKGNEKTVLTFGPLSVVPQYQRKGYGKQILNHALKAAVNLGYDAVVIMGNPENYISSGFKHCKKYNIGVGNNIFPMAMLVKELCLNVIPKGNWVYAESSVYNIDKKAAEIFDKTFPPLVKEHKLSQELFDIYCHSIVVE